MKAGRIVRGLIVMMAVIGASAVLLASSPPAGKVAPGKVLPLLPRMVDVGADRCIPCKKMAPILVEMREDYAAIVDIEFVDVWKDPKAGKPYRVRLIPTQIFYDREGNEVLRHEGFMSREEIETVFREKLDVTPVKHAGKALKTGAGGGTSSGS